MAKPPRSWLRSSIDRLLVPALEQRGFVRVRLSAATARTEMAFLTPHGSFRRPRPQGIETIEIHFDRYDPSRVRHRFRRRAARRRVVQPPRRQRARCARGSARGRTEESYCLLPRARPWGEYRLRVWRWPGHFRVRRWPGRAAVASDYEKLVRKAIGLLPEIERVFEDGTCGPHVRTTNQKPNLLQRFLGRLFRRSGGLLGSLRSRWQARGRTCRLR